MVCSVHFFLLICRTMNTCKIINNMAFILRAATYFKWERDKTTTVNIYFNEFVE